MTGFVLARDLRLAFGGNWPQGSPCAGLRSYGAGGQERFHALRERPIGWIETVWP